MMKYFCCYLFGIVIQDIFLFSYVYVVLSNVCGYLKHFYEEFFSCALKTIENNSWYFLICTIQEKDLEIIVLD